MTVRDMIRKSFVAIGVLGEGESPSAEMQSDGFQLFLEMIDSWATESLISNRVVIESFPLIPNQSLYTFGIGGDFNSQRPMKIERAAIQYGDLEMPVDILNLDQWADISLKSTASTIPCSLFAEGIYPLEQVSLWPVPQQAHSLVLYSRKSAINFASVNDVISLPPGYIRALRSNFTVELAPEFGKSISVELATTAVQSKANIKRMNTKPRYLTPDATGSARRPYSILTGE